MLDRVKKLLIVALLSAYLTGTVLASESTISYVSINNLAYVDVEVVITDDSKILVPFKQLANLFNIEYSANRADKIIGFKTADGKQGVINQKGVYVEDYLISDKAPIFLTAGIMDGVINEAYLTPETVSKIMNIKLGTDFETLSLVAQVDRDIPILANNNILSEEDKGPKAYQNIIAPKKPGKITLNNVGLHSYMLSDNMSTKFQTGNTQINDTFTGSTQLSINGNIMGGKYRIEATEYNYRSQAFMFGGLTGTYANKLTTKKDGKSYWYELGRVRGRSDGDAQIGTNIFGAQVWNYDYDRENPQDLHGYVKPTSMVRLTVNDLEPMMLSTYAGYYSLKDVKLPNPVKSIKLEEINEDGTVELISDEKYPIYGDRPFEKESRGSVYAGVWGYQNRLFRDGSDIYRGNNKKVTAGAYYQHGLKDNVTFESKLTADKIYEKSSTKLIYKVPTNDSLLVTGTQKSVNYLEGATSLNSVEWQSKDNPSLKARGTAGASIAHDVREENTKAGYIVKGTGEYSKDLSKYSKGYLKPRGFKAKVEAFHTSPDFYIASSDSTSRNDRTGGKATLGVGFNSTTVGGTYSKYYSNMNHKYRGGTIGFDEASINASTKIPKVAALRFNSFYRRGENDLGRNKNYFYEANASRDFGKWANLQVGRRENLYDTKYDVQTSLDRNYSSKYYDNYTDLTVPIPNNKGRFALGHSFVRYKTGSYTNGYNIFRFGYTFPAWKNITLGLGWGLKYYGQTGNDLYANVSYRAKSGQTMSVGYQYSQNSGYFIDNMFMPTTNRHSVNFVFNDAFQLFHNGFKSIGSEDLDKGIFEAIAFIDKNQNGVFDKGIDVPIKDIPLIASWAGENVVTNKRGRAYSVSLERGVYKVDIDMDKLPITVTPLNSDVIHQTIRVDGGQTTKIEIPLASTVGSVSGVLKITDDFDRNLKITDFVVVILDENGNEVNYSTVDSTGDFYISGLAPGKYRLQLDDKFIAAYGLDTVPAMSYRDIFIPYDYYNPTDVINQDLEYKTLSL